MSPIESPALAGELPVLKADRIRGAAAIADYLGEDLHRTFRLLAHRVIPAGKEGRAWIASRRALDAYHARATGADVA